MSTSKSASKKPGAKPAPKAPGAVAIQQAMVYGLKRTFRDAAGYAQVNPRTLSSHVAAKEGSNVTPWHRRTPEQQAAAIKAANERIEKMDKEMAKYEASIKR